MVPVSTLFLRQTTCVTSSPGPSRIDELRQEAWARALDAYGTAYIFDVRARRLKKRIKLLTFAGIATPLIVGGVAVAGLPVSGLLPVVVTVAGVLGILQLAVNAWSLTSDWSGSYAHAIQSMITNQQLTAAFKRMATHPPGDVTQFRQALDLIEVQDSAQRERDSAQQILLAETRMGMRAALFERGKECAGCSLKPTSMTPTECGVCGDFPEKWIK